MHLDWRLWPHLKGSWCTFKINIHVTIGTQIMHPCWIGVTLSLACWGRWWNISVGCYCASFFIGPMATYSSLHATNHAPMNPIHGGISSLSNWTGKHTFQQNSSLAYHVERMKHWWETPLNVWISIVDQAGFLPHHTTFHICHFPTNQRVTCWEDSYPYEAFSSILYCSRSILSMVFSSCVARNG